MGAPRPDRKNYPNLTSKACQLSLWPQASKESERHPGQMPRLLLERGIPPEPESQWQVWESEGQKWCHWDL